MNWTRKEWRIIYSLTSNGFHTRILAPWIFLHWRYLIIQTRGMSCQCRGRIWKRLNTKINNKLNIQLEEDLRKFRSSFWVLPLVQNVSNFLIAAIHFPIFLVSYDFLSFRIAKIQSCRISPAQETIYFHLSGPETSSNGQKKKKKTGNPCSFY